MVGGWNHAENLDVFSSGDKDKIDALVQRLRKLNKTSDNMGHFFAPRQFYKPTDCFVCHEPFYDSKNQGMECSGCKMVCHKNCKVETGCQDLIRLKSVAPMYFLTKDIQDRAKWLQGLKYQRMEFERTLRNETGPSSASEKRISSFVESPNSKRVSGIMQGIMTPRRITLMDHSPKS
ncbi:hypothetical protein BC831DRAFT_497674 [Entophlyctis helioformis]|nr:hypothetical protein BC831DRAFT_497674 [Entophlyctis helioformis]